MDTEDKSTIREVIMNYAGIYYAETGTNKIYLNMVEKDDQILFVLVINQDDLGNQFHAMTFGKVIYSVPLLDVIKQAKDIEYEELTHKGLTNGNNEDRDNEDVV